MVWFVSFAAVYDKLVGALHLILPSKDKNSSLSTVFRFD